MPHTVVDFKDREHAHEEILNLKNISDHVQYQKYRKCHFLGAVPLRKLRRYRYSHQKNAVISHKNGLFLRRSHDGSGNFFRWATPFNDDYGKTIDDIEKRSFAFNCQLKKYTGS